MIPNIPFRLQGTSWYDIENDVDEIITTNEEGYLVIENLPRGEYTIQEQAGNLDWVLDPTIHTIVVDAYGNVFLDDELLLVNDIGTFKNSNSNYREDNGKIWITIDGKEYAVSDKAIFLNRPRKHGSLTLRKVDSLNHLKQLYGAEFVLKSDKLTFYGNEITESAVSGADGSAVFEDVEQGKYTLTETVFPDGYVPIIKTYQVICDENGNVSVTGQKYDNGAYLIENMPYTELKLRKLDNINQSEPIEGVEFTLTLDKTNVNGNIDISKLTDWTDGKQVKLTSSNGILTFSQLLDGEYTLTETKAPSDKKHVIDEANPPTYKVIVKNSNVQSISLMGGTDAIKTVFDDTKITGNEWLIYNNRAYENQVTVNKKWIGQPMTDGLPVIHLTTDEPEKKIKVATIDKEIFQSLFDGNTTAFVRHGESYDELTLEDVQNYINADLSDEGELYSNETGSIYMWKQGTEVHFWTDAEIVYLPDDCENLLAGKAKLTSLDLSGFFCDKVTTMQNMFLRCSSLKSIDFGDYFTKGENVTTTKGMFQNCTNLQTVDIDNFQTSELLTDTSEMFRNCKNIQTIKIGSMNTSHVSDMSYMFGMDNDYANTVMTSLEIGNLQAGSELKSVEGMFKNCRAVTKLDLRGFGNCVNLETINSWFYNCYKMRSIDLSNFETSTNLKNIALAFYYCSRNTGDTVRSSSAGAMIFAKGKWICAPNVTTDNNTFEYCRVNLYGKMYKNSNEIWYDAISNTVATSEFSGSVKYAKGDAKHLDIQKQGELIISNDKASTIVNAETEGVRAVTGYFNDANSDYYKNVFCPATYGTAPSPSAPETESSPKENTVNMLNLESFGYACETGEKIQIAFTPNENETYEDTTTYKVEYVTGNHAITQISDTKYFVPETVQITALHIWYDDTEHPSQQYQQEIIYTKELTATWSKVDRNSDTEWACEMQVYDDVINYFVYEDVPKDPNGKYYHSSAMLNDKLQMTDGTFTITNSQQPIGSLSISKVLTDGEKEVHFPEKDEFIFEVTLNDKDLNPVEGEFSGYEFINGKTNISIKADDTIILSGIPEGYTYTVNELDFDSDKYTKGIVRSLPEDSPASDTIVSNFTKAVTWQNLVNTSLFTLEKTVLDNKGNTIPENPDTFTFHVNFSGLLQNHSYTLPVSSTETIQILSSDTGTIENFPVTLKQGECVDFANLPIGAKYMISEDSDNHYTTSYQIDEGTPLSGCTTDLQEVTNHVQKITFLNQKMLENESIQVKISKVWTGENGDTSERPNAITVLLRTYQANITKNPQTQLVSSKEKNDSFYTGIPARVAVLNDDNHWTYTFENLDRYHIENNEIQYEYDYEVEEMEVSGYTSSIVKTEILNEDTANGITAEQVGDVDIQITNTKYPSYYLQISKEVVGNFGNRAKAFTFELTAYQIQTVGLAHEEQKIPLTKLLQAEGTLNEISLSPQPDGTSKASFSLTDKDYLKIKGIPEGTYLSLKEIGYEKEGYTVSATYQFDNEEEDSVYSYGELLQLNHNLNIDCKNERSGILPTGQNLNSKQLILMNVALLSCITLLQWKKRKSQSD